MSEVHEEKEGVRNSYELGYHLVPSLGEADLALRVEEIIKAVTQDGGTLIAEGAPVPCELAYTMRKIKAGMWDSYTTSFFGWVRFETSTNVLPSIQAVLKGNEAIIRFLLIALDKKALLAPVAPRVPQGQDGKEVALEPKAIDNKAIVEEKSEVVEEELDKELEDLIK